MEVRAVILALTSITSQSRKYRLLYRPTRPPPVFQVWRKGVAFGPKTMVGCVSVGRFLFFDFCSELPASDKPANGTVFLAAVRFFFSLLICCAKVGFVILT